MVKDEDSFKTHSSDPLATAIERLRVQTTTPRRNDADHMFVTTRADGGRTPVSFGGDTFASTSLSREPGSGGEAVGAIRTDFASIHGTSTNVSWSGGIKTSGETSPFVKSIILVATKSERSSLLFISSKFLAVS